MTTMVSVRGLVSSLVLFGAAAIGLASATPAHAYVRSKMENGTPLVWKNPCIGLVVHNGNPPAPLTSDSVIKAATAAGAVWSRPIFTCTYLQVLTTPTDDANEVAANDGVNRIVFRRNRWCRDELNPAAKCYDGTIVAVTTVTASKDGTILDADIEVNAKNYTWDDLTANNTGKAQDLQSTLTHELGHLLGLDHNCYNGAGKRPTDNLGKAVPDCNAATNVQRTAIMFPSTDANTPIRRMLSGDEGQAICGVYAKKGVMPTCQAPVLNASPDAGASDAPHAGDAGKGGDDDDKPEEGGCSVGGHATSASPFGFILALALVLRRRRR